MTQHATIDDQLLDDDGELVAAPRPHAGVVLDVVVPVFNEQGDLDRCVRTLHRFMSDHLPFSFAITVADNASTDATPLVGRRLAEELAGVDYLRLDRKGRGHALNEVWRHSDADILAYMDVDLSTDLNALLPLIAPLLSGHSDVAIGTRLRRSARVERGVKRELISRAYNVILHGALGARFSDAQCGFKAIRRDAAHALLPYVEDDTWFFDTELLVLAERSGMRIHEVPVDWVDDPRSSVDLARTAWTDLRGVGRMVRSFTFGALPVEDLRRRFDRDAVDRPAPPTGLVPQVVRFGIIGVLSTLAYVGLFLLFGTALSAQWSNFLALILTAVGNTAANRWFTFGVRGRRDAGRHHALGLGVFLFGWAVTSGSLTLLHALDPAPTVGTLLGVLIAANLVATVVRFVLLRGWVFRNGGRAGWGDGRRTGPDAHAGRARALGDL